MADWAGEWVDWVDWVENVLLLGKHRKSKVRPGRAFLVSHAGYVKLLTIHGWKGWLEASNSSNSIASPTVLGDRHWASFKVFQSVFDAQCVVTGDASWCPGGSTVPVLPGRCTSDAFEKFLSPANHALCRNVGFGWLWSVVWTVRTAIFEEVAPHTESQKLGVVVTCNSNLANLLFRHDVRWRGQL